MTRLSPFALLLAGAVCGCGCTCVLPPVTADAHTAMQPPQAVAPPKPAPPAEAPVKASADPVAAIATLTPKQVIVAAAAAREDASGYVAWRESKPPNIERLTVLTRDLDTAITRMRAHEVDHKYPPGDVFAARAALRALRLFLREKGD